MNLTLIIERLVLDGILLGRVDLLELKAAATAELARLLTEGGSGFETNLSPSTDHAQGGTISIRAEAKQQDLGRQIAGAIYRGIVR